MAPTWFKLVLVVFVIVVLFGRGRISDVMGDFAKGIKSFKKNITEDDTADAPRPVEQTAPGRLESSLDTRAGAQAG
jgi:sec-independent protein translocase protein TatA